MDPSKLDPILERIIHVLRNHDLGFLTKSKKVANSANKSCSPNSIFLNSSLQTFCIPKRNHQRESEKGQESKKVHPDQARNQSTGKEAGKHS